MAKYKNSNEKDTKYQNTKCKGIKYQHPKYKSFDIALYFTTRCIAGVHSIEQFEKDFSFFEKYLLCSTVYLETHRDDMDTPAAKILALKSFFEEKGIKVAGAITTTFLQKEKNKPLIDETGVFGCGGTILDEYSEYNTVVEQGYKKSWSTLCYTDETARKRLQEIVEYTASLFDEIILDDFYFTSCTCPSCIRAKGDKSWEDFRLGLMAEVSQNLVVKPAKAVNPNVNMVIKFPNWYEAYQETGYNPEKQSVIFDGIYTGTETRDTHHSMQHLPRYGSYSLMRWMENVSPGCNGGGWIDPYNSIQNLDYYLEQAFLTFFAKGRELMLFCYSWLFDTVYIPPLGHELEKLDRFLQETGNPVGIAVYEPFNASGEDHLYDYLGMTGLAFEPTPVFPVAENSLIMLTADSCKDENVLKKATTHLLNGGDLCITSGFLKKMQGNGVEEITSARYTEKKVRTKQFRIDNFACVTRGEFYGREDVILPFISYMNNATDCVIAAVKQDNNFPLLLKNHYGKGSVYTLVIPDDFGDLYKYPPQILTVIRQYLMSGFRIYLECPEKIGLFLYDNDTFIVQSFQSCSESVKIHIFGDRKLMDVKTGKEIPASYRKTSESVFETEVEPVFYRVLKIV